MQTQEQDAPTDIIFKLWPWLEANKTRLIAGTGVVIVIWGVSFFVSSQHEQKSVDAGLALTSKLMAQAQAGTANTPAAAGELQQLSAQYAGTPAGLRAQLQAAGSLFTSGNYADAQTQFEKFLSSNATGPLAATAELGLAASLDAQDKTDLAAAAYQRVISIFPSSSCVAEAEFGLGGIAERQNKLTEAEGHFEKSAMSGMGGSLVQEARMRAGELQMKIAAAAPKPAVKSAVNPAVIGAAPTLEQTAPATPAAKP